MRPGELIDDRFEIEHLVGVGGMGHVFRAHDRQRGRQVALKAMTLVDPTSLDRFTREAMLLAELQHPCIVRYITHGRWEGQPYLVMEWLEGEDLDDVLRRQQRAAVDARSVAPTAITPDGYSMSDRVLRAVAPEARAVDVEAPLGLGEREREGLPVAQVVAIAGRLSRALAELHRRNLVHRDIKPSNVFLVSGAPTQAKLLDFGTARATASALRLTTPGMLVGTPMYMSPEQVEGDRPVTPASDVWSLGCLLYECLAGRPAFEGGHPLTLLARIVADEPTPLATLRDDIPERLLAVIDRMLMKSPEARFRDGTEVDSALAPIEQQVAAEGELEATVVREQTRSHSVPPPAKNAAERSLPWHSRSGLTTNESRVLSVLLVRSVASEIAGVGGSREALARHLDELGCDLFLLHHERPVYLITSRGDRAPKERAHTLARAAARLRREIPALSQVLTTGRTRARGLIPDGEIVDQAVSSLFRVGPDEIHVDDATSALIESRFELASHSGSQLLLEEREAERARTLLGRETPWVGRQRELNALLDVTRQVEEERVTRVVLVTAPAGMGKSRLCSEFLSALTRDDAPRFILQAQGDALSAGSPFGLLGPAIRGWARIQDGEPLESRRDKLLRRVRRSVSADQANGVAALIGELAGIPFPDDEHPALRAARQDPMLLGESMRNAFATWLGAECQRRPVLIVLEDLHWGDWPSIQAIDAALETLVDSRLLVLALARPEVHTAFPNLWQRREREVHELHALTKNAAAQLVRNAVGDRLDEDTVTKVVAKAEGNAFYLEELTRFAVEGRLDDVPENVLGMVEARLQALDRGARLVLRAASVFGEVFWLSGVNTLVGPQPGVFDVEEWLQYLTELELVSPQQHSRLPGQRQYKFRHALVRDAAHEMLTDADRELGHSLAGHWLASSGEQDALVLGEHFFRGGDRDAAIEWLREAAKQAFDGNDFDSVLACVQKAVRAGADGERLGVLRSLESQACYWKSEYAQAKACGARAIDLLAAGSADWFAALGSTIVSSARAGDTASVDAYFERALLTPCHPGSETAALVCWCRGAFQLIFRGRFEQADAALERVVSVAERVELDALTRAQVHHVQGVRAAHVGDVGRFLHHLEIAVDAFERAGDRRNVCLERTTLAWCYAELGQYQRARELCEASLAYCEQLGAKQAVTYAKVNLGYIWTLCPTQLEPAREILIHAIEECEVVQNVRLEGWARAHLASVEHRRGDYRMSEQYAYVAVERLATTPGLRAWALATHARALLALGKPEVALPLVEDAMGGLRRLGGLLQGESLPPLVYAECLVALDRLADARRAFSDARARLLHRAERLENEDWRKTFLALPDNRRTLELFESFG